MAGKMVNTFGGDTLPVDGDYNCVEITQDFYLVGSPTEQRCPLRGASQLPSGPTGRL